MPAKDALAITAKYPEPGVVKTRLAPGLGFGFAAELCRCFLRDIDAKLTHAFPAVYWAYTPEDSPFPDFLGPNRSYLTQQGDDLGERMCNVFRALFAKGHEKVVLVGSDLPHLSPQLVGEAFQMLEECDLVLGPAEDGGYYLIGLREVRDLFSYVSWGGPGVLAQTLAKAAQQGLSIRLLPQTFDVDEPRDVEKLSSLLAVSDVRDSMPHTARALERLHRSFPGRTIGRTSVGGYFVLTRDQVEREERGCAEVVRLEELAGSRIRAHMDLVARVAGTLTRRLREDLGFPLSEIAVVAARYHDAFRSDDRSRRLRPYGFGPRGLFIPHDGHESRLAYALRKRGAKTVARIVRKHDVLRALYPEVRTIDEDILLIADAMVEAEAIVPISVRRKAVMDRYARDSLPKARAFEAVFNVVERTLQTYFDAGVSERQFWVELGLRSG